MDAILIAEAGRANGFGETRPEVLEKEIPVVDCEREGEAMVMVEGCWRTEKMNVLFATRRWHCGWRT